MYHIFHRKDCPQLHDLNEGFHTIHSDNMWKYDALNGLEIAIVETAEQRKKFYIDNGMHPLWGVKIKIRNEICSKYNDLNDCNAFTFKTSSCDNCLNRIKK